MCKYPDKARSRKNRLSSQEEVDAQSWRPQPRVNFDDAGARAESPGATSRDDAAAAGSSRPAVAGPSRNANSLKRSSSDAQTEGAGGGAKKVKRTMEPPAVPLSVCECFFFLEIACRLSADWCVLSGRAEEVFGEVVQNAVQDAILEPGVRRKHGPEHRCVV